MLRRLLVGLLILGGGFAALAQQRSQIDVEHYVIETEISPSTHSLRATVQIRVAALEDDITFAIFELHNSLNVASVTDGEGRSLPASRVDQDSSIRLTFPEPLRKGQKAAITFRYDGTLSGSEESPIPGIRMAAIHDEFAYLLYPARWFPLSGYTTDRYTYELRATVPEGNRVIASGLEAGSSATGSGNVTYAFQTTRPAFPGSIAVVRGEPAHAAAEGVSTMLYFRQDKAALAGAYGHEAARIMTFLTSLYGIPPRADLVVVETEAGAPNGYAAEGILFLAPSAISGEVNSRVLANQLARQWWGHLVSPSTRDHLWITNGAARYSELLYIQQTGGEAAFDAELHDTYVDALTVAEPPLIQSSRLEDYSPEFWALTAGKGAAVFHMLRTVIGEEGFSKLLRLFLDRFAWQSVNTGDFRRTAEEVAGSGLQYFFIEWIESTGAPEFRLEYTVYRTQKNFRIVGKVTQDMDTFRMPVELRIETDGNPEERRVEVVGTSSEFSVETFGRPRRVILDPNNRILRFSSQMRVAVAIRRGEQFAELGNYPEALKEYQRALDVNRFSSLAHYRIGEVFFLQNNYQLAANSFREALNGDLEPKWIEVWSHINLGKIFDVTGQRERARNEYQLAIRTKDNTQGAQEEAARYLETPYERPPLPDR